MKIGIVSLPLHTNYGGILQNYALQQVLMRMGHNVITIDQKSPEPSFLLYCRSVLTVFVRNVFCGRHLMYPLSDKSKKKISEKVTKFIDNYIIRTPKVTSYKEMERTVSQLKLDACIVGSDQVWRPRYSIRYQNPFLDFLKMDSCKRLTYAASFGVDTWEYTESQTQFTKEYIKKFDAISVREQTAITLCKKYWNVDAQLVPDPTFLLNKCDYEKLVENENEPECPKGILTYLLDKNESNTRVVDSISHHLQLPVFTVTKEWNRLAEYPSVTHWLRGFIDCKFVISDSFHGTVFSIIFNKPFVVLPNTKRGNTRIYSLLSFLGLEDRIVSPNNYSIYKQSIDWDSVNTRRNLFVQQGLDFLSRSLHN